MRSRDLRKASVAGAKRAEGAWQAWGPGGEHEPSLRDLVGHVWLLVLILSPNTCGRGPEACSDLDKSWCCLQT